MLDISNSNSVPTNEPEENLVHLIVRYLQVLLIHKWVFLCGFVLVFTMVLVFAVKQPKLYKSDYEVFKNMYRLEARVAARTGQAVFLGLLTLLDENDSAPAAVVRTTLLSRRSMA